MTISGKKFLTVLHWVVLVLSAYMLFYEVLDIKELTIDRHVDNSYGDALCDENDVLVNPGDAERREANVPWYGYPLMHLSLYSFVSEFFLIPVTVFLRFFYGYQMEGDRTTDFSLGRYTTTIMYIYPDIGIRNICDDILVPRLLIQLL